MHAGLHTMYILLIEYEQLRGSRRGCRSAEHGTAGIFIYTYIYWRCMAAERPDKPRRAHATGI